MSGQERRETVECETVNEVETLKVCKRALRKVKELEVVVLAEGGGKILENGRPKAGESRGRGKGGR